MRIPKTWVPVMAQSIIKTLVQKNMLTLKADTETVTTALENALTYELMAEDRLNAEVRELLKKYEREIETGRLDYRKLFEMTKQKLVKERNIIL